MANKKQPGWLLVLIGFLKLLQAAMLIFVAIQAQKLLTHDAGETVKRWVHTLRVDPENKHLHGLISRVTGISHHQLETVRLGSYIYASLFGIEGLGLIFRKRWAEYMTVITTGLLLPLEVYELFHGHHHEAKIVVLILNIIIVIYLIVRLKNERKSKR